MITIKAQNYKIENDDYKIFYYSFTFFIDPTRISRQCS